MKAILSLLLAWVSIQISGQVPVWDWVKILSTNQEEMATDVAADPVSGDVYMVGFWRGALGGSIPVGSSPSTDFSATYGGNDGLVVKFSKSGSLSWAFKVGGEGEDRILAVNLDAERNIYITGYVSPGKISFAGTSSLSPDSVYNNTGNADFFLAKYDSDGRLLWMRHSEGDNKIQGMGITSNSTGVYATGAFWNNASFGPLPPVSSGGNEDMFLVKYSPGGDEQWVLSGGSNRPDFGEDLICDETHIYVTGEFAGSIFSITNAARDVITGIINSADGLSDIFIASYNINGALEWTSSITSPEDDFCMAITMDNDSLYLAGSIGAPALFPSYANNPVDHEGGQDAFVCSMSRWNASAGWVHIMGGRAGDDQLSRDIDMDIAGSIYVTGSYRSDIHPKLDSSISRGFEDIFLASYTNKGAFRWLKTAGGSQADFGNGISAAFPGSVYLAGDYREAIKFDSLNAPGDVNINIFLARLKLFCLDAAGGTLKVTDTIVCEADTFGLLLTGYMGDIEWQTSPPGMNEWSLLTADLSDSISFVPAMDADYRVYLRSGSCAPDSSNIVNVEINPLPAANILGDITKCDDGIPAFLQVELSGIAPWEFVIRHNGFNDTLITGNFSNPYFHEAGQPGIYTIESVSDNYCSGKVFGTASLNYLESPDPDPGPGGDVCDLVFALQAIPSTDTGFWALSGGPGTAVFSPSADDPNAVVTVSEFGRYEFRWTEIKGQCFADSFIVVRFLQQPVITLAAGAKVCGSEYRFSVSTDAGIGTWTQLNGPGNAQFLPDNTAPDVMVQVDIYGTYTFQWTVSNTACSRSAVIDLLFLKPADVDAGPDMTIHLGESVRLQGTGGDSVFWTPNYRLSDPNIPDPLADPRVTTIYYLNLIQLNGCFGQDSATVTVLPPDFAYAGEDVKICPGDSTHLNASGGDSYKWDPVHGLDYPDTPDPWAKPRITTTYVVQVINPDGITDTDSVTVFVLPRPALAVSPDQSVCMGDAALLSADGTGQFRWFPPAHFSDPRAQEQSVSLDSTTIFRVVITDADGCRNAKFVTVFVEQPPVVYAGPDQEYIARFETALEANLESDENGLWSVVSGYGNFEDPSSPFSIVTDLEIGDNIFAWNVTNGICPVVADMVNIRVKDFVIPTVITPNGDGKNDNFRVAGILRFTNSELVVMNRWGEEVHRSSPYLNDWGGADRNGNELPEETYYTILKITNDEIRKGFVMIIR